MARTHRIQNMGESPLFVSPVLWNKENVLALLPLIQCEQCGDCCRTCTPIVAQEYEVERIEEYTGERFKDKWERHGEVWHVPSEPCMFLQDGKCSIHPARLVVCKYYPLQRVNYKGFECIAVSAFCDAGSECIKWLKDKANGN